jgi:cell division septation protein DedD
MENRVRDLEQIQEREGDDRGRRIGAVLMAALALVGLTFAMGVVVGRAAEPDATAATADPLAKLSRHQSQGSAPEATAKSTKVEPADLSFPSTLTETEERPEVLRALEAAAAEEAALAQAVNAPAIEAAPELDTLEADVSDPELAADVTTQELVASIPAAVAAGAAGRSLPKAIKHDPMVASAIRNEDAPVSISAGHGHDGEFTLQVISYDTPEPARAFAAGLRDKGHEAFVTSADLEERGRYYRVRIGPFKNRAKAESYRRQFEQDEQMNTFVVRRKDDA